MAGQSQGEGLDQPAEHDRTQPGTRADHHRQQQKPGLGGAQDPQPCWVLSANVTIAVCNTCSANKTGIDHVTGGSWGAGCGSLSCDGVAVESNAREGSWTELRWGFCW